MSDYISGDEFIKVGKIYTTITDLDHILSGNSDTKINDAANAIRELENELDSKVQNNIIASIRKAILDVYREKIDSLNQNIGISSASVRRGIEINNYNNHPRVNDSKWEGDYDE